MSYRTFSKPKRTGSITFLIAVLALAFVFAPATADSPSDLKRVAFEVVDRNAEQIAAVGDVLYYPEAVRGRYQGDEIFFAAAAGCQAAAGSEPRNHGQVPSSDEEILSEQKGGV